MKLPAPLLLLVLTLSACAQSPTAEPDAQVDVVDTALGTTRWPDATPDTQEADTAQADTAQADTAQADTQQADTPDAGDSKPDTTAPDSAQPDSAQPDTAQPDTAQPDTAQPDTTQPDTTQPDTTQPDTAQPDTAQPDTAQPDTTGPDTTTPAKARIVLAGDSWSTGFIQPTRKALDARGFTHVDITWQGTANAGSQAEGWVANKHPPKAGGGEDTSKPKMLDALVAALDAKPQPKALVLVIGGNDFNRECDAGLGKLPGFLQKATYDKIQKDIETLIAFARKGRPWLKIVLVGYDFFHFEFLQAFGLKFPGFKRETYNAGIVELGKRKRAIAAATPGVVYAHNFGLLQHIYGDKVTPPFPVPNPLTGFPPYGPKVAPKPGGPPTYQPYPGGFPTYPGPLAVIPDGIHPSPKAMQDLMDNILDQVLEAWLK